MSFSLPFCHSEIVYDLGEEGQLLAIHLAGRTYLQAQDDWVVFDDGWFRFRERRLGRPLYRQIDALPGAWMETYSFDAQGRPSMVDGTRITYNHDGYVASCSSHTQSWNYHYTNHQLTHIAGPFSPRALEYSTTQQLQKVHTRDQIKHFHFSQQGLRSDTPQPPKTWHRDDLGRLWTVTDQHNQILHTFLWWGFSCLGRIDGAAGEPLACVFSLDATGTPVRATTRTQSKRFTRDAFGENLLTEPALPGLFGAANDGRFFHYQARVLDPQTGSFTAPDPYDGSAQDPRRHQGYRGPVPVEQPPAGPYCVCQNDPIGRVDATGNMSAGVATFFTTLSSLTWGFQNNIAGMQLGVWNTILSLLSFDGKTIAKIGDVEGLSSSYSGAWAVRAHPSGLELLGINRRRAWVVQNLIWSRGEEFSVNSGARVFIPNKSYEPKLFGSLLWIRPKHGERASDKGVDFVICGHRSMGAPNTQVYGFAPGWSRTGGIGTPVFPGSVTPCFPEGGFHFSYRHLVYAPVAATMAEVVPDGGIFTGKFVARQTLEADDLEKIPPRNTVLITVDGDRTLLHTVRGAYTLLGKTRIVTQATDPITEHFRAALFKVKLATNQETLTQSTSVRHLKADEASSKIRYRRNQFLRLEGGTPAQVGADRIAALEARLELDANPPNTTGDSPFSVNRIEQLPSQGKVTIQSNRDIEFAKDKPKPKVDDFIVLQIASFHGVYQVKAGASAEKMKTERDIFAVLVAAATVDWYPATRLVKIGEWNGIINGILLTYVPTESGLAPKAGEAIMITNGDGEKLGGRNIGARHADDLMMAQDLPGAQVGQHGNYKVTVIEKDGGLDADVIVGVETALKVDSTISRRAQLAKSPVLELLPLSDTEMNQATSTPISSGTTVLVDQPWNGSTITVTRFQNTDFPLGLSFTFAPQVGQLVVLHERTTPNIYRGVVERLELTITLDRIPALPATTRNTSTRLKLALIGDKDLYFKAAFVDSSHLVLEPHAFIMTSPGVFATPAAIQTEKVWLPRFRKGQMVRVIWRKGTVQQDDIYRIQEVNTAALELVGGKVIPANQDHYAVCEVEAKNPFNGDCHVAINGKRVGSKQYRFEVRRPSSVYKTTYVLFDDKHAAPVTVASFDKLEIFFKTAISLAAGAKVDVIIPQLGNRIMHTAHHKIMEDEWFFPRFHMFPSPNLVLIKSYQQPPPNAKVAGKLSTGTNLIPNDESDTVELDTREILETHELQHTIQAQTQGPTFFSLIPHFLFDSIGLALGEGLETPEFSAFANGTLSTVNGSRRLQITNPGSIEFAADRTVQMVQNATSIKVKLGALENGTFRLEGNINLTDGQVAVRLERQTATTALGKAHAWSELFSLGGIQSALVGPLMNLVPWSIAQAVHACDGTPKGRFTQPNMFPATVPNADNPFIIQVPPKDGDAHGFQIHDRLEMVESGIRDHAQVVAVNGQDISLDKPARFSRPTRALSVGKIGENHPMKAVTDQIANVFGTQELRWFFDPLGQLFYEVDPNDKSALDWTLSTLRPFYSSTAWSGFGLFGGFWLDIAYTTAFAEAFYSLMEQSASEVSGHTYSPIARLRGKVEYVGDLGRYNYYYHEGLGNRYRLHFDRIDDYELEFKANTFSVAGLTFEALDFSVGQEIEVGWQTGSKRSKQLFEVVSIHKKFTSPQTIRLKIKTVPGLDSIGGIPIGHTSYFIRTPDNRNHWDATLLQRNLGDSPGIKYKDFVRILPFRTPPGTTGDEPNLAAQGGPNSSQALPHHLYIKSDKHPLQTIGGGPPGFVPNPLGSVPISAENERTGATYVAFSQPSTHPHRLTSVNNFPSSSDAKKARLAAEACLLPRQTMMVDKHIKDVTVTWLSQTMANEITLVFCQKAVLSVSPSEGRNYNLTVANPHGDDVARNINAMTILAQAKQGETMVEIARTFDGKSPPTHLNLPFVVPVRQLKVKVSPNLPLRETKVYNGPVLNRAVKPGERFFLFVPAKSKVADLSSVVSQAYLIPPVGERLAPKAEASPLAKTDLTTSTRQFVGAGRAYEVHFDEEKVPEDPIDITWNIPVEAGQPHPPKKLKAVLKATATFVPHFRLITGTSAPGFSVFQLPGQTLTLKTDPQTVEISEEIVIQAKDKTIANAQEMFDLTVSDGGKTLEVKTNAKTAKGVFHLFVQDKANTNHKARRTFHVK